MCERAGLWADPLCGCAAGRRAVGLSSLTFIIKSFLLLERLYARARARIVNLIVGVVIQKNDWLKIFKNHWIRLKFNIFVIFVCRT